MGWDKRTLRGGIACGLSIVGNTELQKDLWAGRIEGYIGYYDECLNFLEDYGIPECLNEFIAGGFLTEDEASELLEVNRKLEEVIAHFSDKKPSNEEIWKSSQWSNLSKLALKVFDLHFKEDLEEKGEPYVSWIHKYPMGAAPTK